MDPDCRYARVEGADGGRETERLAGARGTQIQPPLAAQRKDGVESSVHARW